MNMNYSVNEENGIKWIKLNTESGLEATLCSFGASVYSLSLNKMPLILTIKDKDFFLKSSQYFGKTLGRVAGRINSIGAVDGVYYSLTPTEDFEYTLHGGDSNSLSYQNFDGEVKEYNKKIVVHFYYREKDGTNGFPGALKTHVYYEFYKDSPKLKIIFKASSAKDTLVNLSNHMYFSFNNDQDIIDYKLKMNASKVGEVDDNVFITNTIDVPNYLDFRKLSKLKGKNRQIEKSKLHTIDNTFIFDEVNSKKPQVTLKSEDVKLELYTSYPAMNIYLDNSRTPVEFINNSNFNLRRGIALEPQLYNLDLHSLVLRKGEKYNHFIMYKFKDLRK